MFSADLSHPFIRSRQSNLFGDVKFDIRQTDVSSLNVPLYDDRLRVPRGGGSFDYVDEFAGINKVETELSKGFDWDASSSVGRSLPRHRRTRFHQGNGAGKPPATDRRAV